MKGKNKEKLMITEETHFITYFDEEVIIYIKIYAV